MVIDMLKGFTGVDVTLAHFKLWKATVFSHRCHVMQFFPRGVCHHHICLPSVHRADISCWQLQALCYILPRFCTDIDTQTCTFILLDPGMSSNLNAERKLVFAVPLFPANYYCWFLNFYGLVGPHCNVLLFSSLERQWKIYKTFLYWLTS